MDRRRSVAVHESAHAILARFLNIPLRYISIKPTPTNDTEGETITEIHTPLAEKEGKGSWMKKIEYQRWIMLESAGNLASYMFAGDDFWKTHPKTTFFDGDDTDMGHIRKYVKGEQIPKDEFEFLLTATAEYLALPVIWSFVEFMANELVMAGNIYGLPDMEKVKDLKKPLYDATPLIEWIVKEV